MTPLTLLRTLSFGYLAQHPTRSLLVVLSIALGVAVLVATQALSKGLNVSVQDGVNPLSGLADLQVTKAHVGVDLKLAADIRDAKIDGVAEARGLIFWRLSMAELNNKVVWLLGVELTGGDRKKPGELLTSNPLGAGVALSYEPKTAAEKLALLFRKPCLLSEDLDRELTTAVGPARTVKVRNAGALHEIFRIGTVNFGGTELPLKDSGVVLTDAASASAICFPEKPGAVHQIAIRVTPGADVEAVKARVQAFVGDRGDVQTTDVSKQMVTDVTAGLEMGFTIGGAGALVVGLFLVYNALSVSVSERRHDIGILRSVGATRRQIAGLFVTEAAFMGAIGAGLGLPLGVGLAWVAIKPTSDIVSDLMVPLDSARIVLPAWLAVASVVAGIIVAIGAAIVPAMQAAGEEPAEAVRRAPRQQTVIFAVVLVSCVVVFTTAGVALVAWRHLLPTRAGMFAGIVCLFLGGLIATPLLTWLVGGLVQPLFRVLFGVEGRLAADNLVRAPGRTGIVIAALAATISLMVGLSGFIHSSKTAIYDWLDEKIGADLFVTCGSSVTSGGAALSMKEELGPKLAKIDGIETVLPVRTLQIKYTSPRDGEPRIVFLLGVELSAFDHAGQDRALAKALSRHPRMREPNAVAVSHNFANLYGVKVGDTINLQTPAGPRDFEVVTMMTDYSWNRGTIIMDRATFREVFNDRQIDIFDLFLKPGADAEQVREEVMRLYGQEEALFVISRDDLHRDIHETLQKVYGLVYAQQMVVGVVALLGVVSALFISVLQRRRELGLLRAVGASRGMVLRSVLAEAVLMGVIGAAIGFVLGLGLEWFILDVLAHDDAGFDFPMRVPWADGGTVALAAVALATAAGLWPAYHATRLRIPEAIAYE